MKKLLMTMLVCGTALFPQETLFFSEYIEGSSSNKALEIYNPTSGTVNLDDYIIRTNYNGNPWSGVYQFPSGATLGAGAVFVAAADGADDAIIAVADSVYVYGTGGYITAFNGDDVRALCKIVGTDTTIIDIIGLYDLVDPGSGWDVAGVDDATKDHTLVRKASITTGNTDWNASAGTNADDSEWIVYDQNTFDYLGSHPHTEETLFFSEYIEGSSSNKALEIYNPTSGTVNLDDYIIRTNYNGNPWSGVYQFPSGATLGAGAVFVAAADGADDAIIAVADSVYVYGTGGYITAFNGDDVRALCKIVGTDTTIIDIIGLYDLVDPGSGWDVAGVDDATKDHTLVRKASITTGNTDWNASAGTNADDSEWIVYDQNTFDYLGSHPHTEDLTFPTLVSFDYSPTFPDTNQDVSVTVGAYDNEVGLVVDLYSAVDGGGYAFETMTDNGDSTYSGTLAGQADGVTTSFFALLTDGADNQVSSDTFSVTFTIQGALVAIADIQDTTGTGSDESVLNGQEVTISAIVTAEFWGSSSNRYIFVQDATGPWNGILVFEYGGWDNFDFQSATGVVHSVAEGDSVNITGTVDEYYGMTELTDVTEFIIHGEAVNMIGPAAVTPGQIMTEGTDAEAYEGCLVEVQTVTVDNPDLGNGEWSITDGTNSVRADDRWDYYYWPEASQELAEVVGVLDYTYSNYKIQPRLARDVVEDGTARIQRIQQVLYSDLIKAGEDEISDMSYMFEDTVTIEGIVTMPTGLSYAGAGVKFIFEDEHGGPWSAILSYDPDSSAFPVLYEGDKVRATGYVFEYSTGPANMTELFVTEPVEIVDVGVDQPAVDTVATGDLRWPTEAEPWGNVMVRVADVTVMENDLPYGEWSVDDGSGGVNIDDDSDSIAVWQEENGRPPEGTFIQSIRGWVYHHYGSYVDSTAYKLEPLYVSDIEFGAGPPNIQDVGRAPCVPGPADDVVVGCEISDNSIVASAEIMYSVDGSAYSSAAMNNISGTSWEGTIPATGVDGAKVDYYIIATDDGEGQDEPKSSTYPTDIEQLQLGYTTQSGDLAISDVQFTEWPMGDSPYNGCEVTVTGIVTGDTAQYYSFYFQDTYTIQSEDGPWNGVIFAGWDGSQLTRGDEVTITGTVEEYDNADPYGHYQWDNNTKVIGVSDVVVNSTGNSVAPMQVSTADLAQDAEEVESYEGCLVTLSNVTVTALNSYDWSVVDESGIACLIDDDMANEAADAFLGALEEGQSLSTVSGIFVFSFGTYKIEVRDMADLGEVGIGDNVDVQPYTYKLYPNFPNPFNPETRIRFEIPERERVKVIIYDILGHHVRTLTNRDYDRGYHVLNWDGRNDGGALVSSGVYVCRIKSGKFIDHHKMTLVR